MSLVASASWAAVTVTVWAVSQFAVLNVNDVADTDTSVLAWPLTVTVTVADGSVANLTV